MVSRSESFCCSRSLMRDFSPTSSTCSVETSAVSSAGDSLGVAPSGGALDTSFAIHERDHISQEERSRKSSLELSARVDVALAA